MISRLVVEPSRATTVRVHQGADLERCLPRLEAYLAGQGPMPLSRHPGWLLVLRRGLRHTPYCLEAVEGETTRGFLPLAALHGLLFGRFLVSLPYVNYGGVLADTAEAADQLLEAAMDLADDLDVRYLELRHERPVSKAFLSDGAADKVHMRLELPASSEELWRRLSAKVRNQVRKGEKNGLSVAWGGAELLAEFYDVFSSNMRDLGTPVYGKELFQAVLEQFPGRAEFCVVRGAGRALAAALLLHGRGVTEVPSASSLREFNATCANMLMYWHLLGRAVERGQQQFDFGRCSADGSTYRFKKQWGARPSPAAWQYYLRCGSAADMRPGNPRYRRLIALWQRLPVGLTRLIGPPIVRGIP